MTVLPEGQDALLDLALLQVSGLLVDGHELLLRLAQADPCLSCCLRGACQGCSNQAMDDALDWSGFQPVR